MPMIFDPVKKEVYTDKGEFIKKMNCPYKMSWDALEETNPLYRTCSICDHFIMDTQYLSDDDLLRMVKENPDTCLKIDLNQNNLTLAPNGIQG